jgi:hypothetical protein
LAYLDPNIHDTLKPRRGRQIHIGDDGYPSRQATKDIEGDYPRCIPWFLTIGAQKP